MRFGNFFLMKKSPPPPLSGPTTKNTNTKNTKNTVFYVTAVAGESVCCLPVLVLLQLCDGAPGLLAGPLQRLNLRSHLRSNSRIKKSY